jgi:hypothetical protein
VKVTNSQKGFMKSLGALPPATVGCPFGAKIWRRNSRRADREGHEFPKGIHEIARGVAPGYYSRDMAKSVLLKTTYFVEMAEEFLEGSQSKAEGN